MYTSESNIAAKLGTSLTTEQSTYFNDVLSASIAAYIDQQTETTFAQQDEVTVYASGSDSNILTIPTMHDITALQTVGADGGLTGVSVDSYVAYPQGSQNKYAIRNRTGQWSDGFENYAITGKLGWKGVPADIVDVATEIAVNTFNAYSNKYKSEKVGDWQVVYKESLENISPASNATLLGYRRLTRAM